MKRLCVIGDPVGHSLSPKMHNAALECLGLQNEFVFESVRIRQEELEGFVERLRNKNYAGVSVTMPHKQTIVPLLDSLSEEAALSQAVNTITISEDSLIGHNTDGAGCVRALEEANVPFKGRTVAVFGAGGAAKAIMVSLALEGVKKIIILNRTLAAAEDIAGIIRKISDCEAEPSGIGSLDETLANADILINATPLGMTGTGPKLNVPAGLIKQNMAVFDIVYKPAQTEIILNAEKAGAKTIPGIEMLLHQGALQFKLFTSRNAPLDVMRAAIGGSEK